MATYDVYELWNSREGSRGKSASETYLYGVDGIDGDETEAGARAAAIGESPAIVSGLFRESVHLKQLGGLKWSIAIDYGQRPRDTTRTKIEIDITTKNEKLLLSTETVATYVVDGFTAPNFNGAINVSKGKVGGVDVPVGEAKVTITKYMKPADLALSTWAASLIAARRTYNNATFYGFPAGTLSFRGSTTSYIYDVETDPADQEVIEVPFRFEFSPNVEGLTLHGIEGIAKLGWEYIWPYFQPEVDATAKVLVVKPKAIYRERVFDPLDYSILGIGTGV